MLNFFICLFVLIGVAVIGYFLCKDSDYDDMRSFIGMFLMTLSLIILILLPLFTYFNHLNSRQFIEEYKVAQETIDTAREGANTAYERAALINKIVELNKELAEYKYYSKTFFGFAVTKEVHNLEYIK